MPEDLYCPGQKTLTPHGEKEHDRIFRVSKPHCTQEDHIRLYSHGVVSCPRCGGSTQYLVESYPKVSPA